MPQTTVRQADMSLRHRKIRAIIEQLIAEDAMPDNLTTLRELILARNGGRSADRYKLFSLVMGTQWVGKDAYFTKYPLLHNGEPPRVTRSRAAAEAAREARGPTVEPAAPTGARNDAPAATVMGRTPAWQATVNKAIEMGAEEFKINTSTREVHAVLRYT